MSFLLKVLGSVDGFDISLACDSSKISYVKINSFTFGLLIFSLKACRISLLKLVLRPIYVRIDDKSASQGPSTTDDTEPYSIKFLNILCLPFPLTEIICTKFNVWALGQQTFVDLKPYIFSAFREDEKNNYMDTDEIEEFRNDIININVKAEAPQIYNFTVNDTFCSVDIKDFGIIKFAEDINNESWDVELVMFSKKTDSSNDNIIKLLQIPKYFDKSKKIYQGESETLKPSILFMHHNDDETKNISEIFGIICPLSTAICLIGHPNGDILWTKYDFTQQLESVPELQTLFSTKQPVIGMRFICGSGKYAGYNFMISIGALGCLNLFSPIKHPSSVLVGGEHPFWVSTFCLQSSIKNFSVIQNCLLHIANDGSMMQTDIAMLMTLSDTFHDANKSTELCNVNKITVLDRNDGVLLLHISTGSMYLAICCEGTESEAHSLPLPSLLNECLQQSVKMQNLLKVKAFQRRLFTTLSTFAHLKFSDFESPDQLTFSVSVIDVEPKQYVICVNLKPLQKLDLDSDLCYISISVFSYFGQERKLISKTAPYNPGRNNFSIEIIETHFQLSSVSIFPLFVEVGLILQLPEQWKAIDMFHSLSNCFPFYLRIITFMVHEQELFGNSSLTPTPGQKSIESVFEAIKQLGKKRAISNLLQTGLKTTIDYPTKFSMCLSSSSIEKHCGSVDACEFILQFLTKKLFVRQTAADVAAISENTSPCLSVSKSENTLFLNLTASKFELLVGLRMAVLETIMTSEWKETCSTNTSAYVNIPSSLYRKCEELSKSVMSLFGKDVHSIEEVDVIRLYYELRKELSGKLPLL